jgi:hypothetical protein
VVSFLVERTGSSTFGSTCARLITQAERLGDGQLDCASRGQRPQLRSETFLIVQAPGSRDWADRDGDLPWFFDRLADNKQQSETDEFHAGFLADTFSLVITGPRWPASVERERQAGVSPGDPRLVPAKV